MKQNLLVKLSYLMSKFALTFSYFNPALNDPTLICDLFIIENLTGWQGITRLPKQTDILSPSDYQNYICGHRQGKVQSCTNSYHHEIMALVSKFGYFLNSKKPHLEVKLCNV